MKKEILKFVVLALLAIGFGPAGAAIYQWSQTPATNGTIDGTINWAVGMAPSAVDPSARSMMARIAEYRDDISGALTLTGTSTAYSVTTNQANSGGANGICGSGTVPTNGQMIAVTPNLTNGVAPTITVDGCAAAPLQSSPAVAVASGTMVAGTPYNIKYSTSTSAWMLANFYSNPYAVPLGGLMPYTGGTAPNSNFILPAGQCISTTTYANYWALMGSPASGGCPGGQFAVLDMRGKVPAALDNLNGVAANLLTSSATGCGTAMTSVGAVCANGNQSTTLAPANLPPYTPAGTISTATGTTNITTAATSAVIGSGGNSLYSLTAPNGSQNLNLSANAQSFTGTAQGGTSTAFPRVMPTISVTYILRVI